MAATRCQGSALLSSSTSCSTAAAGLLRPEELEGFLATLSSASVSVWPPPSFSATAAGLFRPELDEGRVAPTSCEMRPLLYPMSLRFFEPLSNLPPNLGNWGQPIRDRKCLVL